MCVRTRWVQNLQLPFSALSRNCNGLRTSLRKQRLISGYKQFPAPISPYLNTTLTLESCLIVIYWTSLALSTVISKSYSVLTRSRLRLRQTRVSSMVLEFSYQSERTRGGTRALGFLAPFLTRADEQLIISILKDRIYEDLICNNFCSLLIYVYIGFVVLNYFRLSAWLQIFHDRLSLLKIELIITLLKLVLSSMASMHMWELFSLFFV